MFHLSLTSEGGPNLGLIAHSLRGGAVAVIPTDTLYGFSARYDRPSAIRRIAALKDRQDDVPFLLLVSGLEQLPLLENSDDFVFDNQMLAQIQMAGFEIGEISCPAAYFEEASSINFRRSVRYGLGVLGVSLAAFLHRKGLSRSRLFDPDGRRLDPSDAPANASVASAG